MENQGSEDGRGSVNSPSDLANWLMELCLSGPAKNPDKLIAWHLSKAVKHLNFFRQALHSKFPA